MKLTIYHNPRCSKSRQALQLLRDSGADPHVVEYLKQPLSVDDIRKLLSLLGLRASELLRSSEAEYRELGLGPDTSDDEAVRAMAQHPKLIQRPIVVKGQRAVIGRPPENVNSLLG